MRVAAAEVVHVPEFAVFEDVQDAARMILDVQPVANLPPVAVDRNGLVVDEIGHEQRDQLFRILIRSVGVRSARDQYGRPQRSS